jgi:hypothetical protein
LFAWLSFFSLFFPQERNNYDNQSKYRMPSTFQPASRKQRGGGGLCVSVNRVPSHSVYSSIQLYLFNIYIYI